MVVELAVVVLSVVSILAVVVVVVEDTNKDLII
jgi:hypothetical protein